MTFSSQKPHVLMTGGDPRLHPEFICLQNEIRKLSHPARPDINWLQVMESCTRLFGQAGADLQSVCWFTLALSHLDGAKGLQEGLRVTEALMRSRWQTLWPYQPADRIAILRMHFQRLQFLSRTWPTEKPDTQIALKACATYLDLIEQHLAQAGLNAASGIRQLCDNVRTAAENAETSPGQSDMATARRSRPREPLSGPDPATAMPPTFIIHPESEPEQTSSGRYIRPFIAGMAAMLVVVATGTGGWLYARQPGENTRMLSAAVPALPHSLTEEQRAGIRQDRRINAAEWINTIKTQSERLDAAGIGRTGSYGADVALLAGSIWPAEELTRRLLMDALARREAMTASPEAAGAWQQGMEKLSLLSEKLNALDEKRGRYLTVSELKSAIFSTQQAFSLHIPAEEWLRRYEDSASPAGEAQFKRAISELQARYDMIRLRRAAALRGSAAQAGGS